MPDLSMPVWIVLAGVLGLLVGSFLNVVILRLPGRLAHAWRREARELLELDADLAEATPPPGLVREPSHCPHCKHRLSAFDNIPVFSWLLLRGRCRYCKAPISAQYPLVEALTAVASALMVWRFGPSEAALAGLVFTWLLIALAGIDVRTQLLPDQLTYPLLWLGLLLALVPVFVAAPTAILGAVIGYLCLWCVYWLFKLTTGKEGMGHGDFKLLAALGAWMGPVALLPIVLLSSLIGALVGGSLIALRKHDGAVPIPFGPFIAAAGWVWFIAGDVLLDAYLRISGLR
jgi:leader peptidase (prepilin peptidase)/N-methyltransferase